MFSRAGNRMCLAMGAVAVMLTTVMGAPGAVLCIASDHTAIEVAQTGNCFSSSDTSERGADSCAGLWVGVKECKSCVDIPLTGTTVSLAAPSRQSGIAKVLASSVTTEARFSVSPVFTPVSSSCSGDSPAQALRVISATILRI